MSNRIDELKGKVKKGLGNLTGNKRLEAEGEVQSDDASAKRKTKGALREAGGAVKEGFGQEAEGTAEKLRGKAERTG
jgi:uncharacterized protein YjbJ (UPF0337 family)